MIRNLFLYTILLLSSLCMNAQETQIKTDFENGIPADFTLIDGDGLTPAKSMQQMGFAVGASWIALRLTDDGENGNGVAASTSWFQPSGQADDWMILPPLKVENGAQLTWRSMASDKKYRDGLTVYVSVEGADTASFDKLHPLYASVEEENAWTAHDISLETYQGKTIWIAFVNRSTNKSRLYVDDVFAGVERPLVVSLDVAGVVEGAASLQVAGQLLSEVEEPLSGLQLTCTFSDSTTETLDYADSVLSAAHPLPFVFETPLRVEQDGTNGFTLTARHGDLSVTKQQTVYSFPRRLVAEELTGTWCAWCVRGITYMNLASETYPETFVGLAVHSGDIMSVGSYADDLQANTGAQSLPSVVLNRRLVCDPSEMVGQMETMMSEPLRGGCYVEASLDQTAQTMDVHTRTAFAKAGGSYRLAYVLKENNVHHAGDANYNQKNAYAGGASGSMGGFEQMPAVISSSDMYFQEVARAIYDDFHGVVASAMNDVEAGTLYDYSHTLSLPSNINNLAETHLAVLILDRESGDIINAAEISLKDLDESLGIENIREENFSSQFSNFNSQCYSSDGMLIREFAPGEFSEALLPGPGLYFLKQGNVVRKVIRR